MNVKILAYGIQERLQERAGAPLKRSHVYELVAAAFGAGSYAALNAKGPLLRLPPALAARRRLDETEIDSRARLLGYPPASARAAVEAVCLALDDDEVGLLPLDPVLERLLKGERELYWEDLPIESADEASGEDFDEDDEEAWRAKWQAQEEAYLELDSVEVVEALLGAAARRDGRAHLALALLADDELLEGADFGRTSADGRYWYERQLDGDVLTGVEKEWAEHYASLLNGRQSAEHHLAAAADLGQHDALLLIAERDGDARFFDLPDPTVYADPYEVATLADRMGRHDQALMWLEGAAEAGDMRAMRELIEDRQADDPLKCWTWFHLAKFYGKDLTLDDYRAVYEDGSDYDDDVGGNMFAIGEDGVVLPAASEELQRLARLRAKELHKRAEAAGLRGAR